MKITKIDGYKPVSTNLNGRGVLDKNISFKANKPTEEQPKNSDILTKFANAVGSIKTKRKEKKENTMQASIKAFAKDRTLKSEEIKAKSSRILKKSEDHYAQIEQIVENSKEISDKYKEKGKDYTIAFSKEIEKLTRGMEEEEKEAVINEERTLSIKPDETAFFKEGRLQKIAEKLPKDRYNIINFNPNGEVDSYYKEASRLDDCGFEAKEAYVYKEGKLHRYYREVIKTFTGKHAAKNNIKFKERNDSKEIVSNKNISHPTSGVQKTGEVMTYKNGVLTKYIKNQKQSANLPLEYESGYSFENKKLTSLTKWFKKDNEGKTSFKSIFNFNSETENIEYCSKEATGKKKTVVRKLWFEDGSPVKYEEDDGPVFISNQAKWQLV